MDADVNKIFEIIDSSLSNSPSFDEIFRIIDEYSQMKGEEVAKLPHYINVIYSAACGHLRETAHSRILYDLLKNKILLESFLQYFIGHVPDGDIIVNPPDKYRIDISIQTDKEFIIIENKVNRAQEMQGQIFRYVEKAHDLGYKKEGIYVLYLNDMHIDPPSKYSLSRDGKCEELVVLDRNLIIKNYKYDIVAWLEKKYSEINESEEYLKSALFQYLDYLKEIFQMNNRHKGMNFKLKKQIKDHLFKEGMCCDEKIEIIRQYQQQISDLYSLLGDMELDESVSKFNQWEQELRREYSYYSWNRFAEEGISMDFSFYGHPMVATLGLEKDALVPYVGIDRKEKDLSSLVADKVRVVVRKKFQRILSDKESIAYVLTTYEDGLDAFKKLLECVEEMKRMG